jgi:RNA polymerase sigma-70 factor, ECF subfamily
MCNEAPGRYTSSGKDRYARGVPPPSNLGSLDDAALARRVAAAGARVDSQAEAELYRRLAPRVRLYGLRHLRDRQAAADLVQQVLLMTLERLRAGKLREPEKIASFVLGTCRMTVLEMRRGSWRRETLLETYGDREAVYEAPDPVALDPDRLAGCLEALAERERSVVVLTFFADKPGEAVAKELGLSAGNGRVIRHRALARLRECMGAAGD